MRRQSNHAEARPIRPSDGSHIKRLSLDFCSYAQLRAVNSFFWSVQFSVSLFFRGLRPVALDVGENRATPPSRFRVRLDRRGYLGADKATQNVVRRTTGAWRRRIGSRSRGTRKQFRGSRVWPKQKTALANERRQECGVISRDSHYYRPWKF
jgi:hypothetical protein